VKISRTKNWEGHIVLMGRREAYTGFWCGNAKESDRLEDPSIDGKIILI
jgi:hypothetical protein